MAQEAKIENYLRRRVKEMKGEIRKLRFIGRRGAPDEIVWIPGWLWPKMPELKAPGEDLKPHQKREHKRLKKMGIECLKIDSMADVDKFLRSDT